MSTEAYTLILIKGKR